MPKLWYETWKPKDAAQEVVAKANRVLREYEQQGFDLTLRQLYYQFVSRGWIANNDKEYNRLGEIVNRARLAGLIDWDHIIDRTRNLRSLPHFNDPAHVIKRSLSFFRTDLWADQDYYVEVWIEKDALVGVIEPTCQEQDVPFFSCRGYTSQSEMWGASQRLLAKIEEGKTIRIFHLGDHDPSGIDMTRDIRDRIWKFLCIDYYRDHKDTLNGIDDSIAFINEHFAVERLALNMDQVEIYQPPPNPAKLSDARARGYVEEYGDESWELDALEPTVMADLIFQAIDEIRDPDTWEAAVEREEKMRTMLVKASERWDEVEALLSS